MVCVRAFCVERYAALQYSIPLHTERHAQECITIPSTPRSPMCFLPLRFVFLHLFSVINWLTNCKEQGQS